MKKQMPVPLKSLDKKLVRLFGKTANDEEVLQLLKCAIKFGANPWPTVAGYFQGIVTPIDSGWLHGRLSSDQVHDQWTYRKVEDFLKSAYKCDVNPLPAMRRLLPKWSWTFSEMAEGEYDINNPPPVGVRDSSGVTRTWRLTDYSKLYKVTAHLPPEQ